MSAVGTGLLPGTIPFVHADGPLLVARQDFAELDESTMTDGYTTMAPISGTVGRLK